MKTRLEQHEATEIFLAYLRWSMPGYDTEANLLDKDPILNEDDGLGDDEPPEPPPYQPIR